MNKAGDIVMIKIDHKRGIFIEASVVKVYPNGMLVFAQDRLSVISKSGECLDTLDIINLVERIL